MRQLVLVAAIALAWPLAAGAQTPAQQVQAANLALGTGDLHTLKFTATGARTQLSQGLWSDNPWLPARTMTSYEATVDFDAASLRADSELVTSPTAGYFTGTNRMVDMYSGGFTWSESTPAIGRGVQTNRQTFTPQPALAVERALWTWASTPQGVLKAAASGTARAVEGGTELSFMVGKQHMTAFVNMLHQVERVETVLANPMLGDARYLVRYTGYRDFGGVQFPAMIAQYLGGYPVFWLTTTGVTKNPAVAFQVPENVRAYKAPPTPTVKPIKVADGVYAMTGFTHASMAVDMGDYIAMVEAPLDETTSEAIIAATKTLIPGKPIRYVFNTHVHFDHSGGLRTYVAEGATVVTHPANHAFYEKAWAVPRTIEPDRLSKSRRRATFLDVPYTASIKGKNGRVIEAWHLQGNPHNEEALVIWLPKERIAFHSDMISGGDLGLQGKPNPSVTNFYDNLKRLKIEPLQFVSGHGSNVATMADLTAAAGHANDR